MEDAKNYNNLEAFLIIICENVDINKVLLESPYFLIPYLCEILINNGADIEYRNRTQFTLLNAVSANEFEVVKKLISLGANVNQTTYFGLGLYKLAQFCGPRASSWQAAKIKKVAKNRASWRGKGGARRAVSYTHLTLPTN